MCSSHDVFLVEFRCGHDVQFVGLAYTCLNGAKGRAEEEAGVMRSEEFKNFVVNIYGLTRDEEPVIVHQITEGVGRY